MPTVTIEKDVETIECPSQVTADNVIRWSSHARSLEGSQRSKAQKLLVFDCIKYAGYNTDVGANCFAVLPLNTEKFWHVQINGEDVTLEKKPYGKDYNSTAYRVYRKEGIWSCDCQGWDAKRRRGELGLDGVACSHVLAVFLAFRCGQFGGGK